MSFPWTMSIELLKESRDDASEIISLAKKWALYHARLLQAIKAHELASKKRFSNAQDRESYLEAKRALEAITRIYGACDDALEAMGAYVHGDHLYIEYPERVMRVLLSDIIAQ